MARRSYPVAGRVVLITGAARGIGAELARELSRRGARLSLVGLEPERLAETTETLTGEAKWFEADVTDHVALERAVAGTVQHLGGIDVVVANAGIEAVGTVETIDPATFERVIEVNLLGVWRTVRATLPHVIARGGYVLPIASAAAATHLALMAPYAASKAGVEAFADSLRQELDGTGVRVGCGYFSFLDTDMVSEAFANPAAAKLRDETRGPLSRVYPLHEAVVSMADDVERRARVVAYPRWVRGTLLGRGLMQPLIDPIVGRRSRGAVGLANEMARARHEPER